jgi:hypothetical protein
MRSCPSVTIDAPPRMLKTKDPSDTAPATTITRPRLRNNLIAFRSSWDNSSPLSHARSCQVYAVVKDGGPVPWLRG